MVQQIGTGSEALNPVIALIMQMQRDRSDRESRMAELRMKNEIEREKLKLMRDQLGLDAKKEGVSVPKDKPKTQPTPMPSDSLGYTSGKNEIFGGFKRSGIPGAIGGTFKALGQNLSKGLGLTDLGGDIGKQAEEHKQMMDEIKGKSPLNTPLKSLKGTLKKRGSALAPDIAVTMIKAGMPPEEAIALVQKALDEIGGIGNVASGVEYILKQQQAQRDDF